MALYRWWERPDRLFCKRFPFVDLDWFFAQESLRRLNGDYTGMMRVKNRLGYYVYIKPPSGFMRKCVGPSNHSGICSIAWFQDNKKMRGLFAF